MALRILIVDDEPALQAMVKEILTQAGYETEGALCCAEALEKFRASAPDAVLLDVMLPDGDGFSLFGRLRQGRDVPVLFVSARDEDEARLRGLGLGADDYIVKPFRPKELELRILSILKRAYPEKDDTLILPTCQVNFSQALITKGELEIQLTAKEYSILKVLYNNQNRIVTFDQLLEKVWGLQYQGYENTMMAHIRKIRQKIEANPSKPECLLTVKGLGYKLKVS